MKTKNKTKKAIRISLIIAAALFLLICGLIINNRVYYFFYSKADIETDNLSDKEIKNIINTFSYLSDYGDNIFAGFDTEVELILYNRKYEFLITDSDYNNKWVFAGYNESLGKNIYKRYADNPQAFAIKINNSWAGSFATYNFYNVSILEQVPIFIPPQIFYLDDIAYRSMIIHEMTHALQGNRDNNRVINSSRLHDINSDYYNNKIFNRLIKQESKILEEAIRISDKNELEIKAKEFIETRESRRTECAMTDDEIKNESEFEWLEGLARYAEYITSKDSDSPVSRNLLNISKKSAQKNDERYYALGMAQIILIQNIGVENWQEKLFYQKYTPEQILKEYLSV